MTCVHIVTWPVQGTRPMQADDRRASDMPTSHGPPRRVDSTPVDNLSAMSECAVADVTQRSTATAPSSMTHQSPLMTYCLRPVSHNQATTFKHLQCFCQNKPSAMPSVCPSHTLGMWISQHVRFKYTKNPASSTAALNGTARQAKRIQTDVTTDH